MPAGFGFARDAQKRFEENRQLRQRKSPFQKMKDNKFVDPPKMTFKEVSQEELKAFKASFRRKRRLENIRTAIITIVFFLIVLVLWILI
ncbi:hypothetical protein [Marinoscillum furvescens]|uniref:Uncharacterized protein n=1 Tax=Marinoscillum furvescens DSM 4134 TaxID=1122208 RepID=A0A3D9KYZ7_MARFU|nr:hypothetical protein [Marinoscillum furvescens]RED95260.1 hypothetical protein C7460_11837 [Marinoscillum furvescens DSM 4134]